jgi:hypothetical protein
MTTTIHPSANGKGRTVWEILTGGNKKDLTPKELQYHNPLKAKVGQIVTFESEPRLKEINFEITSLGIYETKIGKQSFFHTDYVLRGNSADERLPIDLRMRVTPDDKAPLGYRVQLLRLYYEMGWDQNFHDNVLGDPSMEFHVNEDDAGKALETPWTYWRVEDVPTPYNAKLTTMKDLDKSGVIDDNELMQSNVTYWDYHRETFDDETSEKFIELLWVEMDDRSRYFTFYRGREVVASAVTVY